MAVGQRGDVRGETHVQRIDVKNRAARVVQADDVAGTRAAFEDGIDAEFREIRPVSNEVAKKRIAGPEGEKSQGGAALRGCLRKKSVDDLETRAVAAHGNEIAIAFRVSAVRVHRGFAGCARLTYLELQGPPLGAGRARAGPAFRSARRRLPDSRS